jgi:branched-chain amino acid aminotransferase
VPTHVFLNSAVVPVGRARISVLDRGLLYGDGLFETLRTYGGKPFALRAHLERLRTSARLLGIRVPARPWERDIAALLRRNRLHARDAWVRITLTRGPARPGLLPPARTQPTVIMTAGAVDPGLVTAQRRGATVVLLPFARRGFLAEHKVLDYLPGMLGKVIAASHSAFEALYVDSDGYVTEGTTCNLFVCRRGQLLTPPAVEILPGVTRRLVLALAAADGLRIVERRLRVADVRSAAEAFLTSSVAEVVPIVRLGKRRLGTGKVGECTRHVQASYRQLVDKMVNQRSTI